MTVVGRGRDRERGGGLLEAWLPRSARYPRRSAGMTVVGRGYGGERGGGGGGGEAGGVARGLGVALGEIPATERGYDGSLARV